MAQSNPWRVASFLVLLMSIATVVKQSRAQGEEEYYYYYDYYQYPVEGFVADEVDICQAWYYGAGKLW